MADGLAAKRAKHDDITVAARILKPSDFVLGGIWIGPSVDNGGVDLGQDNANATVAKAVEAGIVEFDTAPWYGAGCSEERLGRALHRLPHGNSCLKIVTKTGRMICERDGKTPCISSFEAPGGLKYNERVIVNDFTADAAASSLSQSLARMGLDHVYGLRIHDPNDNSNYDGSVDEVAIALGSNGMLEGLQKLRNEGTIKHIGLGVNCNREAHQGVPGEVLRLVRGAPKGCFDSALLAGGWNLLSQEGLPCLLECQRQGIAVHVAGIFASGLLVGTDRYAYKDAPAEMKAKTEKWQTLADKHDCSLPAVAMAFAALPTVVSRVVVGIATPEQVEQTLKTMEESSKVPIGLWQDAKGAGLLSEKVPLP